MKYNYSLSTSHFYFYPMVVFEAKAKIEGLENSIRILKNDYGDWGDAASVEEVGGEPLPFPHEIILSWWSPEDLQFFCATAKIDLDKANKLWMEQSKLDEIDHFTHFVVGIGVLGGVAIWLRGNTRSVLLQIAQGRPFRLDDETTYMLARNYPSKLPDELYKGDLFKMCMRQYSYRYVVLEEFWNGEAWQNYDCEDLVYDDFDLLNIQDKCIDGTFNLSGFLTQLNYHEAGCPSRFSVRWKDGRDDLQAHYWMDDEAIASVFEKFSILNPNVEIDFLVRIDKRANQYELALIDKDRKTSPIVIPQDIYQILIFKNDVEYFKSENYNQEEGAWYW